MLIVRDTYISDDVVDEQFVCDLNRCKGACCVEGDAGAPLTTGEAEELKESYNLIEPFLSNEGKEVIDSLGVAVVDNDGDLVTPTLGDRECAYAVYDNEKTLSCGIEIAYKAGKIPFNKPISCHLYPIRVTKYAQYDALNYDRWHICSPACDLGKSLKVPVYQFLKEPLIRAYGATWYQELESEVADYLRAKDE